MLRVKGHNVEQIGEDVSIKTNEGKPVLWLKTKRILSIEEKTRLVELAMEFIDDEQ